MVNSLKRRNATPAQALAVSAAVPVAAEAVSRQAYRNFGKRLFDLTFLLLCAPLVVPLVLVFALMVRRDGGPAFFVQERIGRNGRAFACYKLRTMRADAEAVLEHLCRTDPEIAAEWRTYQKLATDPRITRLGKLLRATSLDELPQLLNVLRGDMSLIGPRPFLPSQMSIYAAAKGQAYFRLRPGLSGPWQVVGRGATAFADRVKFDEAYDRNLSLGHDVKLTVQSCLAVLRRTGR
ncbi:sugar transferase [Celeribacter indicus]|uniref:Undecaprenyl-phosphate galactosephosphotransferase n=1 Tax=Celeribacter indicus TaxID=1208324 RepID=A0A0B5DQT2_9RHOB|nr:sugar transferase [Celeribacter indicus]AJE45883.1 undecaprenyl-phosphate galactosephosphotransferase [Celeribacter indicus]